MDCLPKKAAVVERWLLWGGGGVSGGATVYQRRLTGFITIPVY